MAGSVEAAEKQVERKGFVGSGRKELALWAAQVKGAMGMMKVYCPVGGADKPWNWNSGAVSLEFVATLAAVHPVDRPAAVELLAAFAETEERSRSRQKRKRTGRFVPGEFLDDFIVLIRDDDF